MLASSKPKRLASGCLRRRAGCSASRATSRRAPTRSSRRPASGTRGALYHYFADKEALFRAVFEDVETDLGAKAAGAVTGETSFERLGQALHAFLDASLDPEVRRIILIDGPAVLGWDVWRAIEAQHGLGAIEYMLNEGARAMAASGSSTPGRWRICCCPPSTRQRCSSPMRRSRGWRGQRRVGRWRRCSPASLPHRLDAIFAAAICSPTRCR